MLGPVLQHPDDIDNVRCLFIFAPFEDCKRLLEPKLLLAKATPDFCFIEVFKRD
jgi:hypothetical protein